MVLYRSHFLQAYVENGLSHALQYISYLVHQSIYYSVSLFITTSNLHLAKWPQPTYSFELLLLWKFTILPNSLVLIKLFQNEKLISSGLEIVHLSLRISKYLSVIDVASPVNALSEGLPITCIFIFVYSNYKINI